MLKLWTWIEGELSKIRTEQQSTTGRIEGFEFKLLMVATLSLVIMSFIGRENIFNYLWGDLITITNPYIELFKLLHWVGACVLGYLFIPLFFLIIHKRSIKQYYWSPKGFFNHFWGYLILFFPIFLIVYWVSSWSEFQLMYPFYSQSARSWMDLLIWECAYGLQFLALEFFFRAFLLEGLRPSLGYGAIPIMIIPYCMIHFEKNLAECLGSIIAGLILGWLAMRSRSLWGGVVLHWFVAIQMDIMSLIRQGNWPPGKNYHLF